MEIKNEITKEVFERFVPVAKTPERNTSVFSRMEDMLETAYSTLVSDVIGDAFAAAAEGVGVLKTEMLRYVCLTAFVKAARSLDLVLTSTGFGIVSTESTAPASASRVNALIADLRLQALLSRERIIEHLIRIEGWGDTRQAAQCIETLFYRPEFMKRRCTLPLSADNWQTVLQRVMEADSLLREEISWEYMDELLQKVRHGAMTNADIVIFEKCTAFMGDFVSNYDSTAGMPSKVIIRQIVEQLESYPSSYPTYKDSKTYKARHAERYENRSDDPSFFFM